MTVVYFRCILRHSIGVSFYLFFLLQSKNINVEVEVAA